MHAGSTFDACWHVGVWLHLEHSVRGRHVGRDIAHVAATVHPSIFFVSNFLPCSLLVMRGVAAKSLIANGCQLTF